MELLHLWGEGLIRPWLKNGQKVTPEDMREGQLLFGPNGAGAHQEQRKD